MPRGVVKLVNMCLPRTLARWKMAIVADSCVYIEGILINTHTATEEHTAAVPGRIISKADDRRKGKKNKRKREKRSDRIYLCHVKRTYPFITDLERRSRAVNNGDSE